MHKIIISYRRSDSAWTARSIFDRLAAHYGKDSVFMDIDSIPFGIDFREHIGKALAESAVLIAIIGPKWTGQREGGVPRINDENDPVRIEIETALRSATPIIPILVDGSRMPDASDLPPSLADFSFRNAAEVHAGRNFHQQIDHLLTSLDRLLEQRSTPGDGRPDEPAAVGKKGAPEAAKRSIARAPVKTIEPARRTSRLSLFAILSVVMVLLAGGLMFMISTPGRDFFCGTLGAFCSAVATRDPPAVAPTTVPSIEMPTGDPVVRPQRPLRPQALPQNCARPPDTLDVARYCASSVLPPQGGNTYGVQNLFSEDRTTAWIEGKPGQGISEWVLLEFSGPRMVQGVVVAPGYQKNAEVFGWNSRVSKFRLLFSEGDVLKYDLQDRQGLQSKVFDHPIKADWVQLVIEDVFPGSRFTDTAISKLFVTLDPAR